MKQSYLINETRPYRVCCHLFLSLASWATGATELVRILTHTTSCWLGSKINQFERDILDHVFKKGICFLYSSEFVGPLPVLPFCLYADDESLQGVDLTQS